jgi:c-di-AMP phosphodiesterase-like protein
MEFWLSLIIATITICYLLLISKIYIEIRYKRSSENDYILVSVYAMRRLITYKMEVPIIKISESKDVFWLESAIRAVQTQEKNHLKREDRIMKKTTTLFKNHPRKLRYMMKELHYYTRLYCKTLEKILKLVVCEKIYWKTRFGSEDAAVTGTITGLLWACKALLMNRLKRRIFLIGKPDIAVNPIFGCNQFDVDFQCIFSIRLGNVIKAIRSIYNIKK